MVHQSWLLQEVIIVFAKHQQVSQITKYVTLICNSMLNNLQLHKSEISNS